MDLNACGIIAYSNVPNAERIEPSGEKQTQILFLKGIQVEGIRI